MRKIARVARIALLAAAAFLVVSLIVETVIRWLPPDKVVVSTVWHSSTTPQSYTHTYAAPRDAETIGQIDAAFNHDNTVSVYPTFNTLCSGSTPLYDQESYTVTFYWHGLPTQIWQNGPCQEWLRTSGGVLDPWGRTVVPYYPFHLQHNN